MKLLVLLTLFQYGRLKPEGLTLCMILSGLNLPSPATACLETNQWTSSCYLRQLAVSESYATYIAVAAATLLVSCRASMAEVLDSQRVLMQHCLQLKHKRYTTDQRLLLPCAC